MDLSDLWEDDNRRLAKELGETKAHLAAALARVAEFEGKQYEDDVSEETEPREEVVVPTRVSGKRGLR